MVSHSYQSKSAIIFQDCKNTILGGKINLLKNYMRNIRDVKVHWNGGVIRRNQILSIFVEISI